MAHAYHQGHQIDEYQRREDRTGHIVVIGKDHDRHHDGQNARARGQAQLDCSLAHWRPGLMAAGRSAAEQSGCVDLVRGDLEDHAAVRADRGGVVVPGVLSRQLVDVPPGLVARSRPWSAPGPKTPRRPAFLGFLVPLSACRSWSNTRSLYSGRVAVVPGLRRSGKRPRRSPGPGAPWCQAEMSVAAHSVSADGRRGMSGGTETQTTWAVREVPAGP